VEDQYTSTETVNDNVVEEESVIEPDEMQNWKVVSNKTIIISLKTNKKI
jgi:hypothetical protein